MGNPRERPGGGHAEFPESEPPASSIPDGSATLACEVRDGITYVTVDGRVKGVRLHQLVDVLATARLLRSRGPIVVDLDKTIQMDTEALLVLRTAVTTASRTGRSMSVRNFCRDIISEPAAADLMVTMWPATFLPRTVGDPRI